ncbi:hypothetical protein A9Q81_25110 [Gammaproteobacteria bacterium 42_54_T18]|nr:hypothetical protein A9Q81_25110 [Gammaproteobacteria bacterium 42_54_T18]
MTLRFRAFLVSFCILIVFIVVFTLQWQLQDKRESVAEMRIQELMSQAFSSVVIAAERDAVTTVKTLSSTYADLGTSQGDAAIREGLLDMLGVKHDLDFLYVLTGGGHVIGRFQPDELMAQNSQPLRDLDGVLFNQVAGLRWQTTGVGYWQREPLYLTVEKVGNNDQGVRYFVAGYFLKSLFGELNAIYEFEASLDGVAEPLPSEGNIRAKSELKGLITAPINVWIDDQSSPSYRGIPWMLVGIWCVGVIGALLIWLFVRRLMVDRLRDFVQQAHDIGAAQDYGKRVKLQGEDELTDLVSHYNAVVSALEYSYNLMAKANLITTELIGRVGARPDGVAAFNGQAFSPAGIAQGDEDDLRQSLDMVAKLSDVVERETLEIYYQPVVNAESGGLLGFEALCRWLDPDLGVVEPSEFIALAEKSGQMTVIGQQMVTKACRDIRKLHSKGLLNVTVSINLSLSQFIDTSLLSWLGEAIKTSRLKPEFVELEIKEYALARDIDQACSIVGELSSLGVQICIDDFGLSRLSLMYLQRLSVKKIKLAKTFADRIASNPKEVAFIEGVTRFASGLGVKVVAKGVETEQQLYILKRVPELQCQGYAVSRPMPPDELAEWLLINTENGVF